MMVVTVSQDGYIKRVPLDVYRAQGRGGRGIRGSEAKEGDVLKSLFAAVTHDYLLFFSNRGKVYWQKVYNLPEATRTSKGRAMRNLITLEDGEDITNVLRVPTFDGDKSIFFATRGGTVKKTALEAFSRPKKGGIRAILLDEGDAVVGVALAQPGDTLVLCTRKGQAIRFDEKAARQIGRSAQGVRGIRLREGDQVVGVVVADPAATLITGCEFGHGKRTPIEDYPVQGRGGQGVINIRSEGRNGEVVGIGLAHEGDDVLFITQTGMLVRTPVAEISSIGRNTQGVRLVNLKEGDRLVALEIVSEQDLEKYAEESSARSGVASSTAPPPEKPDAVEAEAADSDAAEDSEE
jgi:DNA gyrase subunit A